MKIYTIHHLIKSEDLNHHGTLFAGRSAEWFVEAGFVAAASMTKPENIVCLKIHGMSFSRPVRRGEVVRFDSRIVCTGRSSMVAYVEMKGHEETDLVVEGFITFVHVDSEGKSMAHHITIHPETPEESALQERAMNLQ